MKNKIISAVFLLLLAVSAALFLLPADEASFKSENRSRSQLPQLTKSSFFSGAFARNSESYINDKITFRSELIAAGQFIENHKGITPPEGKIVYTDKDIGTETVKKAAMLIADGKIMEIFTKNPVSEKKYADTINRIAESIGSKAKVYAMLIPTQLEFCDRLYSSLQTNQKKTIDEIYGMLSPDVTCADAYSALAAHSDEYIYYRSDHHWTMLGSYYGYSAFMKAKGESPVSTDNFKKHSEGEFLGYLYSKHPDSSVAENPDLLEWYDTAEPAELELEMRSIDKNGKVKKYTSPMFDTTKKDYSLFFSSDQPYIKITNKKIPRGKTLIIVRDSFASDFAPWCVNNYGRIILLDPRTYRGTLSDVLDEKKADEVLVMNYIFTTSFEDYCDKMAELIR